MGDRHLHLETRTAAGDMVRCSSGLWKTRRVPADYTPPARARGNSKDIARDGARVCLLDWTDALALGMGCRYIHTLHPMGLLPDTQNCGLRMSRECRERFPRHRGLAIPTCITARA